MFNMLRAGIGVLLALLLAGCGAQAPALVPGEEVRFRGTVVDTIDDCVVDGICALVVETDTGRYTAVWSQGMRQCLGNIENGIAIGDPVEVFGRAQDTASVSIVYSIQRVAAGEAPR
jgi:hypothetical protein